MQLQDPNGQDGQSAGDKEIEEYETQQSYITCGNGWEYFNTYLWLLKGKQSMKT